MIACVFDTETSGLTANRTIKLDKQPSIIEFYGALVDLKSGKLHKELDLLIKPPQALADTPAFGEKKTITQITGITNEMLADKPPFKAVAEEIFKLLQEAPVVIAHNASFDAEMINIEAERLGVKLTWPKLICTVEATAYLKGQRLTMEQLYKYLFNETFVRHRAGTDTKALIRCCRELFKKGII